MYGNQTNEIHQETCWSTWWPETAPETSHQNREEEETERSQSETSLQEKAESYASTDAAEDQSRSSSERISPELSIGEQKKKLKELKDKKAKKEEELKELKEKMAKQEESMEKIRSKAFQLANYYLVFQGVVFTAITNNSTSLQCRDAWRPFVLSLLSVLLNLCILFIPWKQYKKEHEQQQKYRKTYEDVRDAVEKLKKDLALASREPPAPSPFLRWLGETDLFLYASVAILFCFVGIALSSCFWLLCRETDLEKQLYDDNKCVKLCGTVECIRVCPQ